MKRFIVMIAALLVVSSAFCAQAVINRLALDNWNELTTPYATPVYTLGEQISVLNTAYKTEQTYEYIQASAALNAAGVYVILSSGVAGSEVYAAKNAGSQGVVNVCVPPVAFTAGQYGWVQIQGNCAVANNAAVTAGDLGYLKLGTTYFTDAGTTLWTVPVATNTYAGNFIAAEYSVVSTATFYLNGKAQYAW